MKNQTSKKNLEKIRKEEEMKGVGLFVLETSIGNLSEYEKEIKGNITYSDFLTISKDYAYFKFLPYGLNLKINQNYITLSEDTILSNIYWKCNAACRDNCDCESEICLCIEGRCI